MEQGGRELRCVSLNMYLLVPIPESTIRSFLIGNKLNQLKFPWLKTVSGSQQGKIDSTQKYGNKVVQS